MSSFLYRVRSLTPQPFPSFFIWLFALARSCYYQSNRYIMVLLHSLHCPLIRWHNPSFKPHLTFQNKLTVTSGAAARQAFFQENSLSLYEGFQVLIGTVCQAVQYMRSTITWLILSFLFLQIPSGLDYHSLHGIYKNFAVMQKPGNLQLCTFSPSFPIEFTKRLFTLFQCFRSCCWIAITRSAVGRSRVHRIRARQSTM